MARRITIYLLVLIAATLSTSCVAPYEPMAQSGESQTASITSNSASDPMSQSESNQVESAVPPREDNPNGEAIYEKITVDDLSQINDPNNCFSEWRPLLYLGEIAGHPIVMNDYDVFVLDLRDSSILRRVPIEYKVSDSYLQIQSLDYVRFGAILHTRVINNCLYIYTLSEVLRMGSDFHFETIYKLPENTYRYDISFDKDILVYTEKEGGLYYYNFRNNSKRMLIESFEIAIEEGNFTVTEFSPYLIMNDSKILFDFYASNHNNRNSACGIGIYDLSTDTYEIIAAKDGGFVMNMVPQNPVVVLSRFILANSQSSIYGIYGDNNSVVVDLNLGKEMNYSKVSSTEFLLCNTEYLFVFPKIQEEGQPLKVSILDKRENEVQSVLLDFNKFMIVGVTHDNRLLISKYGNQQDLVLYYSAPLVLE